jgi:hypothetical protein
MDDNKSINQSIIIQIQFKMHGQPNIRNIKRSHDWKLAVNTMKYLRASLKPQGKFSFTAQ